MRGLMAAMAISMPGGPDVLQPVSVPLPELRPGDVLIEVHAAGVNAPDLAQRRGVYPPPPGASPLPGLEVAGVIVALGTDVATHQIGERVMALTNGGGYAAYAAVPAGQVVPIPAGWDTLSAAALPETFFTVAQTLLMRAHLGAGHWVLVHGAAGGIGGAAILTCRILGAKPIGVVSSAEKAAYAGRLGAEATIDRCSDDIAERVMQITGGHGADRIVDIVGGKTLAMNITASATGGHIVLVSTQAGAEAEINAGLLMRKQLTISGSTLRPQTTATKAAIAARLADDVLPRLPGHADSGLRIRATPLANAAGAHRALEQESSFGKIILVTDKGLSDGAATKGNPIESL
jgi:NADPH2:quinone reductase